MGEVNSPSFGDYIRLNLSIIFISTSGVLGKSIQLFPEVTIFWRSIFAIPFLMLYLYMTKQSPISFRQWNFPLFLAGVLMGIHWVTYFYALQYSNVAIGMLSLYTFPIITAFLEPFFFKLKFQKKHLFIGLLTLVGIYFLVPTTGLEETHGLAVALGILSALCYALRNLILKSSLQTANGSQLMLTQVMVISFCFVPFLSQDQIEASFPQWESLLFLALFTTVVGHSLFLTSLRNFSVTTASIISSTNPLYGILIAFLFLDEIPHMGIIIGGSLILLAVYFENRSAK